MAGAARTVPLIITQPRDNLGAFLIKTSEVVQEGDLVGIDSNGLVVVASKTTGAIVPAMGVAFFSNNNGTGFTRTGDGILLCSVARKAKIAGDNLTTTLVPSYAKGAKVYLGAVPTSTVTNYTSAQSTTAGDKIQLVGIVDGNGDLQINVTPEAELVYQAAATTTVNLG